MKKIYLLGAALLSMTALAQATLFKVTNGTEKDISLVMIGDNRYGTVDSPYPLKKGKSKTFIWFGHLGPIYFAYTDEMKNLKYNVFSHGHKVESGQMTYVTIDLGGSKSYEFVGPDGRRTRPRIPRLIKFPFKEVMGYFSRIEGRKVKTNGTWVDKWGKL